MSIRFVTINGAESSKYKVICKSIPQEGQLYVTENPIMTCKDKRTAEVAAARFAKSHGVSYVPENMGVATYVPYCGASQTDDFVPVEITPDGTVIGLSKARLTKFQAETDMRQSARSKGLKVIYPHKD